MGAPTPEVGYTSATTRREEPQSLYGRVVALKKNIVAYKIMMQCILAGGINVAKKRTATVFRANNLEKFGGRNKFS
jgi:hypothetical protein